MNRSRAAGYERARRIHDHKREYPSQMEWRLIQAVMRSRLDIVALEYEIQDGDWCGWVNIAAELNGELVFIDLHNKKPGNKYKRTIERKREYCRKHNIPYLLVKRGTMMEMQAEIEKWLLRLLLERRKES